MRIRSLLALIIALPGAVMAQHPGAAATSPTTIAPREATQFDFLIGQWELEVRPTVKTLAARIHGAPKLPGTWKAWRALEGFGIEDEMRITDPSGNPRSLSHVVRVYDAPGRRWTSSALDVYRATFTQSTAEWKQNAMIATSRGADGEGKAYISRSRYYDITPTSFRFQQERSTDDGKSWTETLRIEAKRVAATAPR